MTQVQFGALTFGDFEPLPDMTREFSAIIGQVPRGPRRVEEERPRRTDGLVPHFGQGTPTVSSSAVDIWGLAKQTDQIAHQTLGTSEGSVNIPVEKPTFRYEPSVDTLEILIHSQDTRLQPHPLRYFTR